MAACLQKAERSRQVTTEGREERIDERCARLFVRERLVGLLQKGFPTLGYLDFLGGHPTIQIIRVILESAITGLLLLCYLTKKDTVLEESLSREHARVVMEGALLAPAHIAERGEVKKSTGQEQGRTRRASQARERAL